MANVLISIHVAYRAFEGGLWYTEFSEIFVLETFQIRLFWTIKYLAYFLPCENYRMQVVILVGIKFADLAPNRALINIGEIFIRQLAQPNLQRLPGVKN